MPTRSLRRLPQRQLRQRLLNRAPFVDAAVAVTTARCGASRDTRRRRFSLHRSTKNETSSKVTLHPRARATRSIRFPRKRRTDSDRVGETIRAMNVNERRENGNGRISMLKGSVGLAALASLFMAGAAFAQEKIKVGVTATLEGTYTVLGEDGIRGFKTALNKFGTKVGDKQLEFVIASTDATPDSAVRAVRKLIEQDKVQILLSPLSGDEGIAVKNFAKTHPELTFVNAASGAQETTYVDPAPNFFRYNMDGAQWQVGLGKYAYETKGYRKIATVGEDYSFIYTQVFGLVVEFCGAGGQVTNRQWVPLGTKDFASVIAALPDDVDAVYLGLGGADAVNFLNQYQQAGGKAHLLGGSIMVDQTILSAKGNAKKALIGTIAASGQADTWEDPGWQVFVKAYQDAFPPEKRFPSPSLLATNYYDSTMALILSLQKVNGDLSDNQSKLKAALASIEIDAPNGKIKLDSNRQAIGTNFVTEVVDDGKGALFSKVVKVIPNVNQTLGYDPAVFAKIGLPSRTVPECKKY
jgi:ABC-type branched-subunit amino acid transport system substrate-binding protein